MNHIDSTWEPEGKLNKISMKSIYLPPPQKKKNDLCHRFYKGQPKLACIQKEIKINKLFL